MQTSNNPQAVELYETLLNAPSVTKIITAVDKSAGEIVMTKLNGF